MNERHQELHPSEHHKSGKFFQVNIDGLEIAGVDAQAGYDRMWHKSKVQLLDWADRMELNKTLTERQIRVARAFYAHRCLPNLENPDAGFDMSGLVYVMREFEFVLDGQRHQLIAVLREDELLELTQPT